MPFPSLLDAGLIPKPTPTHQQEEKWDCSYSAESVPPESSSCQTYQQTGTLFARPRLGCLDKSRAVWSQDRAAEMDSPRLLIPIVSKVIAPGTAEPMSGSGDSRVLNGSLLARWPSSRKPSSLRRSPGAGPAVAEVWRQQSPQRIL